jgi:hypothetical protein
MRKISIVAILLFFLNNNSFGQYALISINLQDCLKCKKNIAQVFEQYSPSFPIYLVFGNYDVDDQATIIKQIDTNVIKLKVLFNDALLSKIAVGKPSGLFYYNSKGIVEHYMRVDQIDLPFVKKLDSIYKEDLFVKAINISSIEKIVNASIIQIDHNLGTLKVSGNESFKISLNTYYNTIVDSINKSMPSFYKLTLAYIKRYPEEKVDLEQITIGNFDIYKDNTFVIVSLPYVAHYAQEELAEIDTSAVNYNNVGIVKKKILLKFKRDQLIAVYPIVGEYNMKTQKAISSSSFRLLNDSLLIFNYRSFQPNQSRDTLHFAYYKLDKNIIKYKEQLNISTPQSYLVNNIDPMYLNLIRYSNTYIIPTYGNQLIDLITQKNITIDTLCGLNTVSALEQSKGNMDTALQGKIFWNVLLSITKDKSIAYIITILNNTDYYLNVINMNTGKTTKSIKLAQNFSFSTKKYPFVDIDIEQEKFYLEDAHNIIRSYDLNIVHGF